MSGPLEGGAPAGRATPAVLAGRRGSVSHVPAGATSSGLTGASGAAEEHCDVAGCIHGRRPDGCSGVEDQRRRLPSTVRCRSATAPPERADPHGWPRRARSSLLRSTAGGARWWHAPRSGPPSVSPTLCHAAGGSREQADPPVPSATRGDQRRPARQERGAVEPVHAAGRRHPAQCGRSHERRPGRECRPLRSALCPRSPGRSPPPARPRRRRGRRARGPVRPGGTRESRSSRRRRSWQGGRSAAAGWGGHPPRRRRRTLTRRGRRCRPPPAASTSDQCEAPGAVWSSCQNVLFGSERSPMGSVDPRIGRRRDGAHQRCVDAPAWAEAGGEAAARAARAESPAPQGVGVGPASGESGPHEVRTWSIRLRRREEKDDANV